MSFEDNWAVQDDHDLSFHKKIKRGIYKKWTWDKFHQEQINGNISSDKENMETDEDWEMGGTDKCKSLVFILSNGRTAQIDSWIQC